MRGNGATEREGREIHRKRGGVDRETERGGVKEAKSEKDRERNTVSLSSIIIVGCDCCRKPSVHLQSVTLKVRLSNSPLLLSETVPIGV